MPNNKWLGETECAVCKARGVANATIKGKKLYDAPITIFNNSWGAMCRNCYNTYGKKGVGQEYTKNENGVFVKSKDLSEKKQNKKVAKNDMEFLANMLGISIDELM